jgi:hypothetical protein
VHSQRSVWQRAPRRGRPPARVGVHGVDLPGWGSVASKGLRIAMGLSVIVALVSGCTSGGSDRNSTGDTSVPSGRPAKASRPSTRSPATASTPAPTVQTSTNPVASPEETPSYAPGSCLVRGTRPFVLPDSSCTPGATDPAVTQADIGSTICRDGWTATIRPPESYTEALKYRQMTAYREPGPVGGYEEDHLIPLELGGSPASPRNLWPEPGASPNPKDGVEAAANQAVCQGRMTLAAAQAAIATNWIALGQRVGVVQRTQPAVTVTPSSPAPRCVLSASQCARLRGG